MELFVVGFVVGWIAKPSTEGATQPHPTIINNSAPPTSSTPPPKPPSTYPLVPIIPITHPVQPQQPTCANCTGDPAKDFHEKTDPFNPNGIMSFGW